VWGGEGDCTSGFFSPLRGFGGEFGRIAGAETEECFSGLGGAAEGAVGLRYHSRAHRFNSDKLSCVKTHYL